MAKKKINAMLLSLVVMALWGSLFPMVKIGYSTFNIEPTSTPDILMFAAVRFTVCGALLCIWSAFKRAEFEKPVGKNVCYILIMGFFAIVLHYSFTYIGLAYTDSSKTALLKQLGALIYVCFAFLVIKDEKFGFSKIIGAVVGFMGIIAINTGGGRISFSYGDFLIILASFSLVISSILTRITAQKNSPLWVTGISQLGGGLLLLIVALTMHAKIPAFTFESALVFTYICVASIGGYTLWAYLTRTTSLSKLFIIKFAEPLFACIFGALWLGEDIFKIQYLLAFVLISAGIVIGNKD